MLAHKLKPALLSIALLHLTFALLQTRSLAEALPTLVTARQAHSLTIREAQRHYPVHLKGIVTYYDWLSDPNECLAFLHDGSGSIYLTFPKEPHLFLTPGELVEMEGISGPGHFAPIVEHAQIHHLGQSKLPKADQSSFARMQTGSEDGKWVEVKGVITAAKQLDPWRLMLDLQADTGVLRATVMNFGRVLPTDLVDASVVIEGNSAPFFNSNRQLVGVRLFVPGIAQVHIVKTPSQPSALPLVSIADLMRYTPNLGDVHRVRVQGAITLSSPGRIVVQENGEATLVEPSQLTQITLGEEVDVVGFPASADYSSVLRQAIVRPLGKHVSTQAVSVTPSEVLKGSYGLKLITLKGRLVERQSGPLSQTLLVSSAGSLIQVELPPTVEDHGRRSSADWRPGSYLQLTGICSVQVDQNRLPAGFRILLRSQDDVVVLQAASWWSVSHSLTVLCGSLLITLLVVAWVVVLRRRVTEQTEVIRHQLAESAMLKEKAEAANRAKSEFLANMSHEIRTPMNGVLGMIDLALQTNPTPDQLECLDLARSSACSLLTIIGDILDFSKIEAGKLELCPSDFSPEALLGEITRSFTPQVCGKGIQLICEVSPDIPPVVIGDATRLRQVIINLLGNALKFTERGQITVSAKLDRREEDRLTLHFAVVDTGIGIPLNKQKAIFDSFAQADLSTTRRYGGTGLGLAISSRIVALMGGQIVVESEPGAGSRFHFTAEMAVSHSKPEPLLQPRPVEGASSKPLRVLVAEDNLVNQRLVCKQLEKLGHSYTVAATGAQALQLLEEQPFDLVLMDVQMPELDGLEATSLLRRREARTGAHLPVIAVTAHAIRGDKEMCLAAGMDAYVSKPIAKHLLLEAMDQALALGRPGKQCEQLNAESI